MLNFLLKKLLINLELPILLLLATDMNKDTN